MQWGVSPLTAVKHAEDQGTESDHSGMPSECVHQWISGSGVYVGRALEEAVFKNLCLSSSEDMA